jgi:biotin transport system substrate-specific component
MSGSSADVPVLRGARLARLAMVATKEASVVLGFALAIAVGSRIAVPLGFTPVPVTAQTFVVLAGAALLGARRASQGALTYLAFGAAGVPWFAVSGGATLGYLVGFVVAAAIVGLAASRGMLVRWPTALTVMVTAHTVIYLLGASVLAAVLGLDARAAFVLGVAPFLVGDAIKVTAAALLAPALVTGHR